MFDYENDPRYLDIGDLPTGFAPYENMTQLFIRPFCVRELSLLYQGGAQSGLGINHIIRAVNMTLSCDVDILTDGDFEYVMAWLRMYSYPKAPSQVHWTCKKVNLIEKDTKLFRNDLKGLSNTEMKLQNLEYEVCDNKNVEIVHNSKLKIASLDEDDLNIPYKDIDFPRMNTYQDYHKLIEDSPEMKFIANTARWLKDGDSLSEKIELLNTTSMETYLHIEECKKRFAHGISEALQLKCRVCSNTVSHISYPDIQTFFADNSEQNILDIQYSLLSELNMQPDDNMPAKTLLYHHSCLAKDKQREEERERLRKSIKGGL